MKLLARHRLRIPNQLAMLSAILLLVSSIAGYESQQGASSSALEAPPAATAKRVNNDAIEDTAEQRHHGLNLGLLLFRRG